MQKPEHIREGMGLLLVEGADEKYFFIHACEAYQMEWIQVVDFGGIHDLSAYLTLLKKAASFDQVKKIAILRDAETNAGTAIRSIQDALKKNDLLVPDAPFRAEEAEFHAVMFGIFPGKRKNDGTWENGALEDLCLAMVSDDALLKDADDYVKKADNRNPIHHKHKARLHTFLAGKEPYIGMKIGEAAKAKAWDGNSSAMEPFHELMRWLNQ